MMDAVHGRVVFSHLTYRYFGQTMRQRKLLVRDVLRRVYYISHMGHISPTIRSIIRYDSVYLTCSKKLTGSQLSPPHGTNKKIK